MKNFIIEIDIDNSELNNDFCYTIYNLIKFYNWYNNDKIEFKLITINDLDLNGKNFSVDYSEYIPIGSIEFVHKYMNIYNIKIPNTINIPNELNKLKYIQRNTSYCYKSNINKFPIFIKPANELKLFTGGVVSTKSNLDLLFPEIKDNTILFVSDVIDIVSEYRCLVYNNELVGLQHYLGDFTIFPDIETINNMIIDYKNSPVAYTLDVGVYNGKTILIECHNFYSVGLYGFNRNILLNMFQDWFIENKKSS